MACGADTGRIWRRWGQSDRSVGHPRRDQSFRRELWRVPRADVHDGRPVATWLGGAETQVSTADCVGRIAPAVICGYRADHGHRHDQNQNLCGEARRSLYSKWPEGVDIARAAFGFDVTPGTHDTIGADQEED